MSNRDDELVEVEGCEAIDLSLYNLADPETAKLIEGRLERGETTVRELGLIHGCTEAELDQLGVT
jgi:hypothetical protein